MKKQFVFLCLVGLFLTGCATTNHRKPGAAIKTCNTVLTIGYIQGLQVGVLMALASTNIEPTRRNEILAGVMHDAWAIRDSLYAAAPEKNVCLSNLELASQ